VSLDTARLEKVRELAGGIVQARCPACAEGGGDRKGEHLRVHPDGRYGCCVHPKDGEHRKRIFALAGVRKAGTFTLRLKTPPALPTARSVKSALGDCVRTLRTGVSNSVDGESSETAVPSGGNSDFRTLRTPISDPRAYAGEDVSNDTHIYKDLESGVLSVLSPGRTDQQRQRMPFFTTGGTLSIPFDSPERYHWWKRDGRRLTVKETIAELRARQEEVENGTDF
jgi:hypothetical protein